MLLAAVLTANWSCRLHSPLALAAVIVSWKFQMLSTVTQAGETLGGVAFCPFVYPLEVGAIVSCFQFQLLRQPPHGPGSVWSRCGARYEYAGSVC